MAWGDSIPTQPGRTTIHSLGEDLLLAIFLHLPSIATLVRAAFTCQAWRRAVASNPVFRRRFRELHPAPLLGVFFQAYESTPNLTSFPTFAPARPRDRDLAAAVRGGDFFLTFLQYGADESHCWYILDCSRGYVLLVNWDHSLLLVLNPLTRRTENAIDMGSVDVFEGSNAQRDPAELRARLLCSDDPASLRVVVLALNESRVRASVFSYDTGEWLLLPWMDVPAPVRSEEFKCWLQSEGSMQANGFLYWVYEDWRYLVSLDTVTMKLSVTELPPFLRGSSFDVGETKDGATCLVYAKQLNVGVVLQTRDDDGFESWVLGREVSLHEELQRVLRGKLDDTSELIPLVDNPSDLYVLGVQDGYVFLATSAMHQNPLTPSWFLSLCLESMKLDRLFWRKFDNFLYPYTMAWPSSLLGNYGRFTLEDAL